MKTYPNCLTNYKDIQIKKEISFEEFDAYLQKQMKQITRKYKRMIETDEIQKADTVTLDLESTNPKFNRQALKLTVGSNLYSKELEEKLIGLNVNEEKYFMINNDEVKVKVLNSMRTIFLDPTDEMIKEYVKDKDDLKHIQTVDEYIQYFTNQFKEERKKELINKNVNYIIEYVVTHTDWNFDEDEINDVKNLMLNEINQYLSEQNLTLEKLSKDELLLHYNVSTLEEFLEQLKNAAEYYLACACFLVIFEEKEPKDFTFEEANQLGWDKLVEYVENQMKNR